MQLPLYDEFKKFAMRGNVIDMAVGIIIGAAFGKIVSSLVTDIVMPPIGLVLGKVNFSDLFIDLSGQHHASLAEAQKAGAATINYGIFINNVVDFLIVAWVIFLVVRQLNRLMGKSDVPVNKNCPYCYSSIDVRATRCPQCTMELASDAS
ncbi:MAG TPA: large-conductance mechanosensitive channel protein MscL [Pirellulales bacterium]|jgi:large conductance mechanosensitive channel|nr:large-conductance mechanosensitive channel protein MscL [Pirellulales bacterium]